MCKAILKGLDKSCKSYVTDGTDNNTLWNDSDEDRKLALSVRKMKAQTVKMETLTLIGKGR
jgi:hypothetical protein